MTSQTPEEKLALNKRRQNKRDCLKEIRQTIQLIGPWSVNKLALSEKYGVDWKTVDNWVHEIIAETPKEELETVRDMGLSVMKRGLGVCEKVMVSPDTRTRDRISAVATANDTLKTYTEFMESYGLKAKVPEQSSIQVSGGPDIERLMGIAQNSGKLDKRPIVPPEKSETQQENQE